MIVWMVGLMAAVAAAAGAAPVENLPASVELVADHLDSGVIHGWHSNRIVRYGGRLYTSGVKSNPGAQNTWKRAGAFYRREDDGRWTEVGIHPQSVYSMLVDPKGVFWAPAPADYADSHTYRMRTPLDFTSFERVYDGTCAYMGAAMSPEGNVLLLNAETGDMQAFVPNAVISSFYERRTGRWTHGRMVTPEGRYGYMGIVLRGKRALAVLNSAIQDPKANPVAPHYSWRHVRLATCDDLTKGRWTQKPWLMPDFGSTSLHDLMIGRDGAAYLAYAGTTGSTAAEAARAPSHHCIARIGWDMSVEVHPTGLDNASSTRLFEDAKGRWWMAGRTQGRIHLWLLDPAAGWHATREWAIEGTERMEAYVIHTLRPERFGGQSDGNTIHLITAGYVKDPVDPAKQQAELWHCAFRLPDPGPHGAASATPR